MKYMMFVITDSQPDTETDESDVDLWVDPLDASGKRIIGEVLQPQSESRVVRVRDGKRYVTDGPFTDTRDLVGGSTIVQASDLDAALEWGRKLAQATTTPIEVRAFF